MKENSVKLKLPGRDEWVQVTWNQDIEIVTRRAVVPPLYSYRWEVDGDERIGREAAVTDTAGGPA